MELNKSTCLHRVETASRRHCRPATLPASQDGYGQMPSCPANVFRSFMYYNLQTLTRKQRRVPASLSATMLIMPSQDLLLLYHCSEAQYKYTLLNVWYQPNTFTAIIADLTVSRRQTCSTSARHVALPL